MRLGTEAKQRCSVRIPSVCSMTELREIEVLQQPQSPSGRDALIRDVISIIGTTNPFMAAARTAFLIPQYIAQLDSENFENRQRAMQALAAMGLSAAPQLAEVATGNTNAPLE